MPSKPTNQTGPPVKGNDFYDREEFVPQLWERIEEGANILLLAPRRVGKSSVMFKLVDQAKSKGFQPLMVSVAGVADESQFIKEIIKALAKVHAAPATKLLDDLVKTAPWIRRTRKFGLFGSTLEIEPADWTEAAEHLQEALGRLPDKWLILIDELPIFVLRLITTTKSPERAELFLAWFRDLRQGPQAPPNTAWFLAGSIGLDTVTQQANIGDTINDLHKETRLGPFDDETAGRFVTDLADRYELQLAPEVRSYFLTKFSWLIPYHIQLLFSEVRDIVSKGGSVEAGTVDAAYQHLLSPQKRGHFDFWIQRLEKELPAPLNTIALVLIDIAAKDDKGVTRELLQQAVSNQISDQTQLDFLLQVLQTDGYLIRDEERYRFRSTLLQDFWKRTRIQ